MIKMPLVSVIMPSYNHAPFISQAIKSVLEQAVDSIELIIIDDASSDSSRSVIEEFTANDSRVSAIFHARNKGIAATMNEGVGMAKGKYVASLASDDVWVKGKLTKQLNILEKNEDLIVWSEGNIIDEDGRYTNETFTNIHGAARKKKSGDIFIELLPGNYIFGCSLIATRKILSKLLFSEELKYLNDWLYYVELAKEYEFYFIDEPLANYRMHQGNTSNDRNGYLLESLKVTNMILQRYRNIIPRKIRSDLYLRIAKLHKSTKQGFMSSAYAWVNVFLS